MLVEGSAIMEVGTAQVWSSSGASDATRWESAGELRLVHICEVRAKGERHVDTV